MCHLQILFWVFSALRIDRHLQLNESPESFQFGYLSPLPYNNLIFIFLKGKVTCPFFPQNSTHFSQDNLFLCAFILHWCAHYSLQLLQKQMKLENETAWE